MEFTLFKVGKKLMKYVKIVGVGDGQNMSLFLEFKELKNWFKVKLTEFMRDNCPLGDEALLRNPFEPIPGIIINELG